jgi:glycosyltransferase involved in cell wall biosynthesis
MKIAFIHDYLNQYGGAERVLQVLCSMFPRAPIYTTVYDPHATGGVFEEYEIRTSFLQRIPFVKGYHHVFSFLMPFAIEQFDVSAFDVVFSVSSSFSKGIITNTSTKHICYCLTPPRFLWDDSQKFIQDFHYPPIIKKVVPPLLSYLRVWDRHASSRIDKFIAISNCVSERIEKYYGMKSSVVYPPVNLSKFYIADPASISDYFLMVGRLVTYKKFDIAIRAFNHLKLQLKIVGTGPELVRLRKMAKPNIEFLGLVSDKRLADLYAHSQALIFPQEEDFGIVPLESMASGRPVVAYAAGGVLETIKDADTGVFFEEQDDQSLINAINRFRDIKFDSRICRKRASDFDIDNFKKGIYEEIEMSIK